MATAKQIEAARENIKKAQQARREKGSASDSEDSRSGSKSGNKGSSKNSKSGSRSGSSSRGRSDSNK